MKWIILALCLAAVVLAAAPQRHGKVVASGSPDELLLERIENTEGSAQIAEIEIFLEQHPKHPSTPWLLALMQQTLMDCEEWQRAISAGERLLALFPDDLDAAMLNRQSAEKLQNAQLAVTWARRVEEIARQIQANGIQAPAAEKERILTAARIITENAKSHGVQKAYAEATSSSNLKSLEEVIANDKDPARLAIARARLMQVYRDQGNTSKALHYAEEILKTDPKNTEALLTAAQIYLDRRSNYPAIFAYSKRALDVLGSSKRPDHLTDDQWQRVKASQTGTAHLIQGNAYVSQNAFANADRALRTALLFFQGNDLTRSSILFFIGWSNYYLENYTEAAKFFDQCVKHGGAYKDQAFRQLNGMKTEGRIRD